MTGRRTPAGVYAHFVATRARAVLAGAAVLTVVLALGLPRLEFSSTTDTMVPTGSRVYRDNVRYQAQFGGDPMLVLFAGDVRRLLDDHNRSELAALERDLMATGDYHAVFSPLTALRFGRDQVPIGGDLAVRALGREQEAAARAARRQAAARGAGPEEQERAAEAARAAVAERFARRTAQDAERLAAAGEQTLGNPAFVEFLVFDGDGGIRPTFTGVFPDARHALFVVRMAGNLTIDEQGEAASRVVEFADGRDFEGVEFLTTGSPLLLKEINDRMRSDMATMGAFAMAVMAAVLLLVLRVRWRLLSLPVTLLGIAWAFGVMGYAGIPLTMVTISSLPILIGLGVDFAIQAHVRYEDEERARHEHDAAALEHTLAHVGRALAIAMVAAVAGFLSLRLSRVPMIRDFGTMLSIGAAVLFVIALVVVPAVLAWRGGARAREGRGAGRGIEAGVRWLAGIAAGRPGAVLAVIAVAVAAGVWAQPRIPIQSDPERFVPPGSPVLDDLHQVRDVADSSGEMGLLVEADDVLRDDVLAWMARFEERELRRHRGVLFRSSSIASITQTITGSVPVRADVESVVGVAPESILRTFLSDDRRRAHVIFAIGPVSLVEQKRLIADLRADVDPPPGVDVTAAGLTLVGIEAVDALSTGRTAMTVTALGAVLVWLLLAFRRIAPAVLALLPVLAAAFGAVAVIHLAGIEVNSLSGLSSPLVVAVCTEFAVLVLERYREERAAGGAASEAVADSSLRIGRAFTASGLATAGGFAVLAASGFPLLTSFGVVVAVNVLVALLAALVLMPPLLVAADRWLVRS